VKQQHVQVTTRAGRTSYTATPAPVTSTTKDRIFAPTSTKVETKKKKDVDNSSQPPHPQASAGFVACGGFRLSSLRRATSHRRFDVGRLQRCAESGKSCAESGMMMKIIIMMVY
jgi:hypothetical protein